MAEYINKAAATSVCNTQRAYSTMQIIQDLKPAKVIDREQLNDAMNEVGNLLDTHIVEKMLFAKFANMVENKLFGGASDASNN